MATQWDVSKENRIVRPIDPITLRRVDLCEFLNVSLSTIDRWISLGKMPGPASLQGISVWRKDEIEAWVKAGSPDRAAWNKIRDEKLK